MPRNLAEPHDTMALSTALLLERNHHSIHGLLLFAGHRKSLDPRRYQIYISIAWIKERQSLCLDFAQSAQTRAQVMSCLCSSQWRPPLLSLSSYSCVGTDILYRSNRGRSVSGLDSVVKSVLSLLVHVT